MPGKPNWPNTCGNCAALGEWEHLSPKLEEDADFVFINLTLDGRDDVDIDVFRCEHCGHVRLMARLSEDSA